jgi:hypothetical protein
MQPTNGGSAWEGPRGRLRGLHGEKGVALISLQDRIKNSLDEARMLMLGAQVLLGFQYSSVFQRAFERLPLETQYLKVSALGLMLVAVGLLLAPAAYHQIADDRESRPDFPAFISQVMALALLPFALGLGIDLYVATRKLFGVTPGAIAGVAGLTTAVSFWYFLGMAHRSRHPETPAMAQREETSMEEKGKDPNTQPAKLKDKVDHALTEARVVLPGAQALLGFQFAAMLAEGFEKLPPASQHLHLVSLVLIALSTILLMTPAAYHRIGEHGEYTEHFLRFTGRCLLGAMVPLALGITGDFYVVVKKVCHSGGLALGLSVLLLLFFFGLWFGLTQYHRMQHERPPALLKPHRAG